MKFFYKILISFLISGIVICVFTGISCSLSPEGISILSGDYDSPKLLSFDLQSESRAQLAFSREINLDRIKIRESVSQIEIQVDKENLGNGIWNLNFEENLSCTKNYLIEGNVKDQRGNSLYFKDKFQGFNSRVPEIILNEIRSEYSKPKCEFVELYTLSDGNLGGMQLICASDGIEKSYIFPSAEVKAGEYIVLHFRSIEEDLIDEVGENTSLSKGCESGNHRDLWIDNKSARIAKSDVILLKDRINGKVIDAVLYCESENSNWKNQFMQECAEEAFNSSIWKNGFEVGDAVCSDGLTCSRTLSRINKNSNDKESWIVVATSGASPGKENSSEKYLAN
ncbi:MAG: hypothetical protein K5839_07950 [Treponemataceae bacterium]|nr:hypothetical protein [Treponemataceae bacterium]